MIELRNVQTVKSGKTLLDNFSWTINSNEHWIINGPNGSGKTSLLELIAAQQYPRNGSITYDFITGETWEEQFQQKRALIQFIPTHAVQSLLPSSSEVYYQQRYYSIGDEINVVKVKDLLKGDVQHFQSLDIPPTFNIEPLLDREVKRLSNGQLKKVLILQRLLNHLPKLLVLDYPFEGLDRASRKDFCDFIDFIAERHNIQIIIADHGHQLPKCITHQLTLKNLAISKVGSYEPNVSKAASLSNTHKPVSNNNLVINIKDLKIQYGDTVVPKDFNWSVRSGDRWALIGANGSGKTTLFSIIFADHPMAYSQEVYLFGRKRGTGESIWEIKKRINYLGPELINYLDSQSAMQTGREYILTTQKPVDQKKLEHLIGFFEAHSFIDKPIKHLSSGQLQLALLIGCFTNTKELLLLDEPFQFLSTDVRDRVSEYLQQYLSDDITLILITHYDEDLARWTEKTMKI